MENTDIDFLKLINEIGVTGVLRKIIIANTHFKENLQDNDILFNTDIKYILNIPVLNNDIQIAMEKFKTNF